MKRGLPPMTRRQAVKLGLMSSGALLIGRQTALSGDLPPSPRTTPFVEPLPLAPIARPVAPFPTLPDPIAVNVDGSKTFHVAGPRAVPTPARYYLLHERQALHSFHPELPQSSIWGYNGITPGPTFLATSGTATLARFVNDLPLEDPVAIGLPISAVHHHGGFTSPENDGYPLDTFTPGQSRDYLYENVPADGLEQNEPSTHWYHDHALDTTAENVYRGLAGFYLNFDSLDSLAGEEDLSPRALRLPGRMRTQADGSPVRQYDIPLVFQDRSFNAAGFLDYNSFQHNGFIGDKFVVNGKIQPFMQVERRKYRFRLLNGSNARVYEFFLRNDQPFDFVLGADDELFEHPIPNVKSLRMAAAERFDIVIDFSRYPTGTQIILENRLEQVDGRKPKGLVYPGTPILKFIVGDAVPDPSRVPDTLRPLTQGIAQLLPLVKVRREFKFNRSEGAWQINGYFFDENRIDAKPKLGEPEIWSFEAGGGWLHPVHTHLSSFFILSRNGNPPSLLERGRKDTVRIGADEGSVEILVRFPKFAGRYVFHCHTVEHEDMRMMGQFEVQP